MVVAPVNVLAPVKVTFDPVIRAAPEPDITGAITTAEFPAAVSSEPAPRDRAPLPRIEASVRL